MKTDINMLLKYSFMLTTYTFTLIINKIIKILPARLQVVRVISNIHFYTVLAPPVHCPQVVWLSEDACAHSTGIVWHELICGLYANVVHTSSSFCTHTHTHTHTHTCTHTHTHACAHMHTHTHFHTIWRPWTNRAKSKSGHCWVIIKERKRQLKQKPHSCYLSWL